MTPLFIFVIGALMISLAKFIKFFGAPAPFGLVMAVVGLILVIFALVIGTYDSRK